MRLSRSTARFVEGLGVVTELHIAHEVWVITPVHAMQPVVVKG